VFSIAPAQPVSLLDIFERSFDDVSMDDIKAARPNGNQSAVAFLHVPKTGGTYLGQRETDAEAVISPIVYLGHSYVGESGQDLNPIYLQHDPENARNVLAPKTVETYFVFSTVRNIFAWLVSYAGHAGGWNPKYPALKHYDRPHANKGFEYLIKVIANREDQWPNRKFIHCQLFSGKGDLVVDWVNRQETLDEDLASLAPREGLEYRKKAPQRVGATSDYRRFYNDELIELVSKTWGRELSLFGYDLDGCSAAPGLLGREISKEQKGSIKYFWKDDKLAVAGAEVPRR
jgi:hypothetical protein